MFTGKATAVEYLEPDDGGSEPPIRVTFEVLEVWKGPVRPVVIVSTVYNKFTCNGYFFKAGEVYVVAAGTLSRDAPQLDLAEVRDVSLCGGTSLLVYAEENLRVFGAGQRPE